MRPTGLIVACAVLVALGAAAVAAVVLLGGPTAAGRLGPSAAAQLPAGQTEVPDAQPGLADVEESFGRSYAAYLDGASLGALRHVSVTATAQARSGGRIPVPFRDGELRVVSASSASGAFSAQAQLVLANREERYSLAMQLLREQHGWQVEQLQPPDLTIDETIRPVIGVNIPLSAQSATRRFATAYAAYRDGIAPLPAGMNATAASEIHAKADALAGVRLPAAQPRVIAMAYGPLNDGEFAATATVRFGATAERFSLLMQLRKQTGGWLCAAFL